MILIDQLQSKQWIKDLPASINAYIVGGCVRDSYLNRKSKDIDIVLENTNFNFIESYLGFYGKVDIVGESFGVIKFKPFNEQYDYDIALTRSERKIGTGHKGFDINVENVSILDDLSRRDFTINAIAINIKTNDIIDPYNGINDIKNKLIKVISDSSFKDDPLRMLRAVQFSLRLNFNIHCDTLAKINIYSYLIKEITAERILIEFEKVRLNGKDPYNLLLLLYRTDLDRFIFKQDLNIDYIDKAIYDSKEFSSPIDKASFYYLLLSNLKDKSSISYKKLLKGDNETHKNIIAIENLINIVSQPGLIEFKLLNIYKLIKRHESLLTANNWFIFRNCNNIDYLMCLHYLNLFISKYYPTHLNPPLTGDDIMNICNIKEPSVTVSNLFDAIMIDIFSDKYHYTDITSIKNSLITLYNKNIK